MQELRTSVPDFRLSSLCVCLVKTLVISIVEKVPAWGYQTKVVLCFLRNILYHTFHATWWRNTYSHSINRHCVCPLLSPNTSISVPYVFRSLSDVKSWGNRNPKYYAGQMDSFEKFKSGQCDIIRNKVVRINIKHTLKVHFVCLMTKSN